MEAPILTQVAAGDAEAMQICIDRYSGLVWRLAWRLLPSRHEIDDAVQDVFVSLWENAHRFTADFGEETTFVAMITRRRLIDRGRRMRHQRELSERARERAISDDQQPGVRAIAGQAPSDPSQPATDSDDVSRVRAAMQELPARQREVIELSLRADISHAELAQRLDMPLGTVKTLIRRGMLKLREIIEAADAAVAEAAGTPATGSEATR
ncbi:MAG: RNA polymerase sigma factor [Phycisphaerales bacterium]